MRYSLVESFTTDAMSVRGQTLPTLCLVEDDDDAIRYLIANSNRIPSSAWVRAQLAGVSGIIIVGSPDRWMPAERVTHPFVTEIRSTLEIEVSLSAAAEVPVGTDWSYRALASLPDPLMSSGSNQFVHLHAHSEFSPLDGLSTVQEMVDLAVADDQPAIAVTDHGVCSAHPELQKAADRAGIKPIFGLEGYFVADRTARGVGKLVLPTEQPRARDFTGGTPEQNSARFHEAVGRYEEERERLTSEHAAAQKRAKDYQHIILWAKNDAGLRNLWAMSTASYLDGFYGKPRIDWDLLARYSEGVMCSTACLRGPLAVPILNEDEQQARSNLGRLLEIFGDENLYAEIHTNGLEEQRRANTEIIRLADEYGIPTIAVVDSHYPCADDAHAHKVWLSAATNKELADETGMFQGHQDYHLMTAEEVRKSLSYLPEGKVEEAISNTVSVADRCSAGLRSNPSMPLYSRPIVGDVKQREAADIRRLAELALGTKDDGFANFIRRCQGKKDSSGNPIPMSVYMERYEREMRLLVDKGFCGYFLMVAEQVKYAKDNGILVGPGRGSGGGCLVAYLIGITEIDPVEADLLFERFLSEGREDPPDFDVDYPASAREMMQDFCSERWGVEHTMRVGTHLRLKAKGVLQDLSRVFRSDVQFGDFAQMSKIITAAESHTSGKGLTWDELMDQHGDEFDEYREKYPEIFELAERFYGRLKSYGKHPAGMVISPDEVLTDNLPMRSSDDAQPISQFDMDSLAEMGYIKFDLLTLRTLDTIQWCIDLIRESTGQTIDIYSWRDEYGDTRVWDAICSGDTLGMFQIETAECTKLARQVQPRSISDLSDVITLVRPGPKKSGLTASYLRRRDGLEAVTVPDDRLAEVLAPSQGCIIYQEQVMKTAQILAGYSLPEAEGLRKILGKKKTEKVEAAGQEFVARCVAGGMDRAAASALWDQLGEFAKYSFNRSHAWAYAMMGYWCAWFKVHYPLEFITAVLSTVKKERVPEFINDARRHSYGVLPPDINTSGKGFTMTKDGCRFGFDGIDGIGAAATEAILEGQPYTSFDDFMERKGSAANRGVVYKLAQVGAFDSLVPHRRSLVERLLWESSEDAAKCIHAGPEGHVDAHGLPCTFDWAGEPQKLGKSGRPLKNQPRPPKKCSKACRNYTAPSIPSLSDLPDYTEKQVRSIERELLGVYLSSTPFDIFYRPTPKYPEGPIADLKLGREVDSGLTGDYRVPAIITRRKEHESPRSGKMAFLTIDCIDADLDVVVFKDTLAALDSILVAGQLGIAVVRKNARGISLSDFVPIITQE